MLKRVLVFLLLAPSLPVLAAAQTADVVLVGGKIVTVDKDFAVAEAVAIRNGKFAHVGTSDQVRALIGPDTNVIDLEGKTVVPGFIDAHAHIDREGLKFLHPSLTGARSIANILEVVRAEVAKTEPGEWIVTMPIGDYPFYFDAESAEFLADGRFPNRWDLDGVAPENPVYIRAGWHYWRSTAPLVSVANSQALALTGVTRDTEAPHESIEIVRDTSGEPTGVFLERGGFGTTVLSDDILTCDEDAIRNIQVMLTMVGGKIVHRKE